MSEDRGTRISRLDERIAGCQRRIGEAREKAERLDREARACDEAGGILASWGQQASGIWQDLHQYVKGDVEWRRLEQEHEERAAMAAQARNACLEAHDDLARRARREHEDARDIREEQDNLRRARRECGNDGNRRRDPWA
ncbi:hypothetical protein PT279_09200 [Bifidobacterium sp. ESL0784]|uniref:hypothetical protein n=1 Tax=Bifidobacterium sp. ESL0784 TaxID=2983231 RepID=UPI0023F851BC|nr:hypothetical protein [Bifidobacterium sp. ESL0784]MDF7641759.1 hypothetical protein [Bifidobacterium sp. ESL0784]